MRQNIEVIPPLFAGQVNECFQFTIKINGDDFRGIFHDDGVQWFQPQPYTKIENIDLDLVEANVRDLVTNR